MALSALGCAGGERTASPPTEPLPPHDTTGTVQRGTLTGTVTIDSVDRAIAAALTIEPLAPQGLVVTLTRLGTATTPTVATSTDANGRFSFANLLEGAYQLSVERVISDEERHQLPLGDADVTTIAGGAAVLISAGTNSATLTAVAGRRGSLVISEVWPHKPALADRGGAGYYDGTYLEVFNNSDTTVFLDGVVFGTIPPVHTNLFDGGMDFCGDYASSIRLNESALALASVLRFPGTGRDYPLAPGRAVIIAQDAINHQDFAPTSVNLSDADFESIGDTRDVDNPAVPNMVRVSNSVGALGRGFSFGEQLPGAYVLVAANTDFTLRTLGIGWGENLHFAPRGRILDFVGMSYSSESRSFLNALGANIRDCDPWMAPVYERAPAPIATQENRPRFGYARRVLRTLPDGRAILQRTRTSARDWYVSSEPTPRQPR
jgi:hypothetical protein